MSRGDGGHSLKAVYYMAKNSSARCDYKQINKYNGDSHSVDVLPICRFEHSQLNPIFGKDNPQEPIQTSSRYQVPSDCLEVRDSDKMFPNPA